MTNKTKEGGMKDVYNKAGIVCDYLIKKLDMPTESEINSGTAMLDFEYKIRGLLLNAYHRGVLRGIRETIREVAEATK
jgi:hypothetical protein